MAAKGGIWTKKGFVKAANRKDAGGVAVADTDPATKLNSSVSTDTNEKKSISDEAYRLYREAIQKFNTQEDKDNMLFNSQNILAGVGELLEQNLDNPNVAGIIVKSKNGKPEAVSAIKIYPETVYVEYLATHPDNVFKDNPKAVKGAGTQAMARAAKLAQERGTTVSLFSVRNAKPFYEKLGFKPDPPGSSYYQLSGSDLDKLAAKAR